jgi:drug/metabolite transporter (DMT)-like permease
MFSKADIERYFIAEKSESLWFLIFGIAAICLAIVFFFFIKTNWYKGAAIPLLIFGVLQFAAGYTVYKNSDKDRLQNVYAYDMNPATLKTKELPRMEKVDATLKVLLYGEVFLFIAGIALFFYFKKDPSKNFWAGFFLVLVIEAILSFAGDRVAFNRAKEYKFGLEKFLI